MNHFGPRIAADLRKRRLKPHTTWHLDEVYLKIDGRMVYLWRAVDAEGEVLDVLVQSKRNKHAALKLMRKLLKKYAFVPERLVTDDLRSYSAAVRDLAARQRDKAVATALPRRSPRVLPGTHCGPLAQIAWLLGYGTATSFTHAFRRWADRRPSTVRSE